MVEDIRKRLNYNYKITAQKFRDTSVNAERFGTPQPLFDTLDRNVKTLQDLVSIIHELKKDRRFDLVDSYTENNTIVKVEVKAENLIRELQERGSNVVELDPRFIAKSREIFDIYERTLGE
jgi:hypothetical protein